MSRIEWRKVFSAVAVTSLVMTNIAPVSAAPALTRTESALRSKANFGVRASTPTSTPTSASRPIVTGPASQLAAENASAARHYMVELDQDPATLVFAKQLENAGFNTFNAPTAAKEAALQAAETHAKQLQAVQARLAAAVSATGATEIYRVQKVYNGMAVLANAEQAAALAQLPGVKRVYEMALHTLDHGYSVPLIGAPSLWDSAGIDATGTGVRVGVIDTGIDYFHATFGGNSTPITQVVGGIVINPLTGFGFTGTTFVSTTKVVGGYDFAGDTYNAAGTGPALIPNPDGDPMDCPVGVGNAAGHGTHVAGTVAGFGVNPDGTTYTGTYGLGVDYTPLRIGPGVAPNAELYALRVFGCSGSTALTPLAIEWAMDPNGDLNMSDRLDVINMSLGSTYGSQFDTSAIASNNAAAAGVIVVASAGNSSDVFFISGSPGSASRVLATASSVDAGEKLDGFVVLTGTLAGIHAGSRSVNFNWNSPTIPLTGTLVRPASSNIYGCSAFNPTDTAVITGNIVFLEWIDTSTNTFPCSSGVRFNNAQAAGARGVILADRSNPLSTAIAGNAGIPGYIVPSPVGDALRANLTAGITETGITLVLTTQYNGQINAPAPEAIDTLSSFSSRGIRRYDYGLKPDIAAPGQSIFSASSGSGAQGRSLNGTSMAAPHMAGSMALLREIYPTWSVEQLKALAMNTAHNVVRNGNALTSTLFGPQRVGAGRVDLVEATASEVVAYGVSGDPGAVNVSFGMPQVTSLTAYNQAIHVDATNLVTGAVTYNTEYAAFSDIPGVTVTVLPSTLNATASTISPAMVRMDVDPTAMLRTADPTLATAGRQWFSEEAGYALFIPQNAPFQAVLAGANEVPPVTSPNSGLGSFTYDSATNTLNYTVLVTAAANMTVTMAHIHLGYAEVNGPVQVNLLTSGPVGLTTGDVLTMTGSAILSALQEQYLLSGDMYVNIHTSAVPSGELRGQLLNVGPAALRVPVHGAPRAASDMSAALTSAPVGVAATAPVSFTLSGQGISTADDLSLITAFELHEISPKNVPGSFITDSADLWALGMTSNFTGNITTTTAFLGLATWGPWSTPTAFDTEFDIYVDVGADGNFDFIFFNVDSGYPGTTRSDAFRMFRCTYPSCGSGTNVSLPNMVANGPAAGQNTNIFNNHGLVVPLPVPGLTITRTKISYFVATYHREGGSGVLQDISDVHTFDLANPGLTFTGSAVPGLPVWGDLPGNVINANYNRANYVANGSQGALFLHHHNKNGFVPEIVDLGVTPEVTFIYHDLEDVVLPGDTLHLAGAFNGWPGAGALMSADPGNTVFSITVPITPGTYQFKYQVNSGGVNWDMVNTNDRTITVTTAPEQTREDYRHVVPGYQILQWPPTLNAAVGVPTNAVYGRVFVNNVTNGSGPGRGLRPEVGFGISTNVAAWTWFPMAYNAEDGNNDEYMGVMTPTMSGVYSYVVRFNGNWGTGNPNNVWAYGDLDGVHPSEPFELENAGVMTVVNPSIVFTKTVSADGCATQADTLTVTVGAVVDYCFTVENTGDVTLTTHALVDPMLGISTTITLTLMPGMVAGPIPVPYTASVAGTFTNTATFTATDGVNTASASASAVLVVQPAFVPNPSIVFTKTVSADGCATQADTLTVTVGAVVNYCFVVTNDGNVPFDNHVLSDTLLSLYLTLTPTLAPGDTVGPIAVPYTATLSGTSPVTMTNTAAFTSTNGSETASATDTATLVILPRYIYLPIIKR